MGHRERRWLDAHLGGSSLPGVGAPTGVYPAGTLRTSVYWVVSWERTLTKGGNVRADNPTPNSRLWFICRLTATLALAWSATRAPDAVAWQRTGETASGHDKRWRLVEHVKEEVREALPRVAQVDSDTQRREADRLTRDAHDAQANALKVGDANSQLKAGLLSKKAGLHSDAFKWLKKAADQGSARACYELATLYVEGLGVPKEPAEVFRWCRKAAELGDPQAQHETGLILIGGVAVKADTVQGIAWIQKAADQGYALAACDMGNAYFFGNGVEKDAQKAFVWLNGCAANGVNGSEAAQVMLGAMCDAGVGTRRDTAQATFWYSKAAEKGNEVAAFAVKVLKDPSSRSEAQQKVRDAFPSTVTPPATAALAGDPSRWSFGEATARLSALLASGDYSTAIGKVLRPRFEWNGTLCRYSYTLDAGVIRYDFEYVFDLKDIESARVPGPGIPTLIVKASGMKISQKKGVANLVNLLKPADGFGRPEVTTDLLGQFGIQLRDNDDAMGPALETAFKQAVARAKAGPVKK